MKRKIAISLVIISIITGAIAYHFYNKIYIANVHKTAAVYIKTGADFQEVQKLLEPYINHIDHFTWVAKKKNYHNKIRPGKFKISKGMSNDELVNHLRGGAQETIKLTFNNQDSFEKLAGRVALQIEADSISLIEAMREPEFLEKNNFNVNSALAMYIPNSYEFYWNTSATQFRNKMLKEFKAFWNDDRLKKAKKQDLTPIETITLASIVQKETSLVVERPTVAGLYLNRYHDKWPLQADPTIIFALKQKHGEDAVFKRVLNKDLEIESPYNTYRNVGLPPGPIGMPDISSIEAVLQPENHRYYYMCASIEQIGKHEFASNLKSHLVNARKYQNWMNQQGINR